MHKVIPVTIIGGYLGSGKTTLVNHLLRHAKGARLAVLVNDFGELPIDADLIEAQDGDVISLSGGCVCCSYGDDLSLSLQKLHTQEPPPDHIFIEASGVALPGAIAKSLSLHRHYQLDGIVVLADATTIQASATQKYIADTIQRQLSDADLIVLNKQDLLSDADATQVSQWVNQHYSHAPLIDAVFSTVDPAILYEISPDQKTMRNNIHADNTHDASSVFSSISLNFDKAVDAHSLAAQLADKQHGLIRAKGFVLDLDNTLKTIQVVGRRWSVTRAPVRVTTGVVCIAFAGDSLEEKIRSACMLNASITV